MQKKIKILFVTKHVVNNTIAMAGHQSFNYYLNKFCDDKDFEVGYLVVHKADDQFKKMDIQFQGKAKNFSINIPLFYRLFTYLYYKSFFRLLFSLIRPEWYYLDPIYAHFYKKALSKLTDQWVPDVVVFEWTEMIFLKNFYNKIFKRSISIATEHDLSFIKLNRRYDQSKFFRLFLLNRFKQKELETLKEIDLAIVLSKDDRSRLYENDISNVLLLSPFYQYHNKSQKQTRPEIVFFGAMNRIENQEAVAWFIDKVFIPYRLFDSFSFIVIGSGVPNDFKNQYSTVTNLIFTGFVQQPEDYFSSALCMVVPLTNGGGIKIKIIEAMTCSVPVLTNEIGIEGINGVDKVSYLHCISPSDYNKNITTLLNDLKLAKSIGEKGRQLIQENFDFTKSYFEYKSTIVEFLSSKNYIK